VSSVAAVHVSTTETGEATGTPARPAGVGGGMKSGLGSPPFSAAQSTAPAFTAAIAAWNAGSESFGVRSAQYASDCQPDRPGSSASRKLKYAATPGWQ
jgi:hypothetical protein